MPTRSESSINPLTLSTLLLAPVTIILVDLMDYLPPPPISTTPMEFGETPQETFS
jgi:hypothetical protein